MAAYARVRHEVAAQFGHRDETLEAELALVRSIVGVAARHVTPQQTRLAELALALVALVHHVHLHVSPQHVTRLAHLRTCFALVSHSCCGLYGVAVLFHNKRSVTVDLSLLLFRLRGLSMELEHVLLVVRLKAEWSVTNPALVLLHRLLSVDAALQRVDISMLELNVANQIELIGKHEVAFTTFQCALVVSLAAVVDVGLSSEELAVALGAVVLVVARLVDLFVRKYNCA